MKKIIILAFVAASVAVGCSDDNPSLSRFDEVEQQADCIDIDSVVMSAERIQAHLQNAADASGILDVETAADETRAAAVDAYDISTKLGADPQSQGYFEAIASAYEDAADALDDMDPWSANTAMDMGSEYMDLAIERAQELDPSIRC